MARTVNATLRTVRRDAFLDVAQRLVQTKGYEAMSIQDVLGELEASKGAFYHYFDSKQALLQAVVERRDLGSFKGRKGAPVSVAAVEDGGPRQACLRTLEDEHLEEVAIVA